MTQVDIEKLWKDILKRYLEHIEGFGWLIQTADKEAFQAEVVAYDTILKAWVAGFKEVVTRDEDKLVKQIVDLIKARAERSPVKERLTDINIDETVRSGINKIRVIQPRTKLVFKDISWESTRDGEFTEALRRSLPAETLKGWFEEFTAARQRSDLIAILRTADR